MGSSFTQADPATIQATGPWDVQSGPDGLGLLILHQWRRLLSASQSKWHFGCCCLRFVVQAQSFNTKGVCAPPLIMFFMCPNQSRKCLEFNPFKGNLQTCDTKMDKPGSKKYICKKRYTCSKFIRQAKGIDK